DRYKLPRTHRAFSCASAGVQFACTARGASDRVAWRGAREHVAGARGAGRARASRTRRRLDDEPGHPAGAEPRPRAPRVAGRLRPGDFGLVARANLLPAFVGPIHDSGLASAFVARRDQAHDDAGTLTWGTTLSGVVGALIVAAAAPVIATVFHAPPLRD